MKLEAKVAATTCMVGRCIGVLAAQRDDSTSLGTEQVVTAVLTRARQLQPAAPLDVQYDGLVHSLPVSFRRATTTRTDSSRACERWTSKPHIRIPAPGSMTKNPSRTRSAVNRANRTIQRAFRRRYKGARPRSRSTKSGGTR